MKQSKFNHAFLLALFYTWKRDRSCDHLLMRTITLCLSRWFSTLLSWFGWMGTISTAYWVNCQTKGAPVIWFSVSTRIRDAEGNCLRGQHKMLRERNITWRIHSKCHIPIIAPHLADNCSSLISLPPKTRQWHTTAWAIKTGARTTTFCPPHNHILPHCSASFIVQVRLRSWRRQRRQ